MTKDHLQLDTRTLLRILRKDTLFFDVPNPQIGCFVVLYTNNAIIGSVAKDIVFGTVRTDRLRDRDALTEQITPEDIEHIRIAGSSIFNTNNELKVVIPPYSGNRFHADEKNPGLAQRNALFAEGPMPPTHRTIFLPTAQEDPG
jgi:hypothetical protein